MKENHKKILLVGNPNVGKSVIFSRLTGIGVISSNYPGTTVEISRGYLKSATQKYEIIDVPGLYSLEPTNNAEGVASALIQEGELIVDIIDATNLERNLNLTLQLIKTGKPLIVVLNFWDETKHIGISINREKLEDILGVPVFTACGITGEGIKEIVSSFGSAKKGKLTYRDGEDWAVVGKIIGEVQKLTHKHHTLLERLSDLTIKPWTGIPIAAAVLLIIFYIIRCTGELLINMIFDPVFTKFYYSPLVKIIGLIPSELIRHLLIGKGGVILESFGILTTGVYIPLVLVLPYLISFYIVLSFLEDFGYLPRVAILLDNIFHHLGLHGYSCIPIILGIGCKVPAILSTRILESEREKIIAVSLILISAPCMPQTAMIISLGASYGVKTILSIFVILLLTGVLTSALLNKLLRGESPELFVEIPPYRIPHIATLAKKMWLRIKTFLYDAVPMIMLGVVIMALLDVSGIMELFSKTAGKVVFHLIDLPESASPVLLLGFLRKDVSIAMLKSFPLTSKQFIISSIFMVMYLPCVASFFTLTREMGIKIGIRIILLTFLLSLIVASILNILL